MYEDDAKKSAAWSSGFNGGYSSITDPYYDAYRSGQIWRENLGLDRPPPDFGSTSSTPSASTGTTSPQKALGVLLGAFIVIVCFFAALSPNSTTIPNATPAQVTASDSTNLDTSTAAQSTIITSIPAQATSTLTEWPVDQNTAYANGGIATVNYAPMDSKIGTLKCGQPIETVTGIDKSGLDGYGQITWTKVYYPNKDTTAYVPTFELSPQPPPSCQ